MRFRGPCSLADESAQYFRHAFDAFDTSGSGKIEIDELQEMLMALGNDVPDEDTIRDMIHTLVSTEEKNTVLGTASDDEENLEARARETHSPVTVAFNSNVNCLNFEQFVRFMTSYFQVDKDKISIKDVFRVFDCDDNGLVSAAELIEVLRNHFGLDLTLNEAKAMIEMAHDSNNEDLTLQEFRSFYRKMKPILQDISNE